MTFSTILTVMYMSLLIVGARRHNLSKRELPTICDVNHDNSNKVECYCLRDTKDENYIRSADCSLKVEGIKENDKDWELFSVLENVAKLTLTTNSRGISLLYIPSKIFTYMNAVLKIDVKYGHIEKLQPFAFSNCSTVQEISLTENQVHILKTHAIAYHKDLKVLNLDQNIIEEINRDVFVGLPSLELLFLTGNKITTLHDRAFLHLNNLLELEINMNSLFSLNSETFAGLKKLEKLDLSSNSLEVIGDNTFLPLNNLKSLNLEGNKIVMLDEKSFNGLRKMQTLSLAHNKLNQIDSTLIFQGLPALTSLSLRGNEMKEIKMEIMAPILVNFNLNTANLDIEDNNLTCTCQLDWFLTLMTNTVSKNLKIAMENLKCVPEPKLREAWTKIAESDKNPQPVDEDIPQSNDYEYYDDAQLNGKLFYIDVRDLLFCNGPTSKFLSQRTEPTTMTTIATKETSPDLTTKSVSRKSSSTARITNHGTLDLSFYETTPKNVHFSNNARHEGSTEKRLHAHTTTRLATVSAKPMDNKLYENMASDEAKPDKLRLHRNYDHEPKENAVKDHKENSAHRNLSYIFHIFTVICFRLLY